MYVCACVCVCLCMCVCLCICVFVHMHNIINDNFETVFGKGLEWDCKIWGYEILGGAMVSRRVVILGLSTGGSSSDINATYFHVSVIIRL